MLSDMYSLGGVGVLQRLHANLAQEFAAAFAAAEPDLREWMPSAAKEQEDAEAFVDACVRAFDAGITFAYAVMATTHEVIGYINLTPVASHAVVAYWVHPQWRGSGIAARAARVLVDAIFASHEHIQRVHAHLDAANVASRRVLDHAGFHHHETFTRPPRTRSESETEWLYVRERYARGTATRRLLLRDVRADDVDAMARLWTDRDVARFMDGFGPRTPDEVAAWVPEAVRASRSVPGLRSWAIEVRSTGEVVGWIGFGGSSRAVADIDFAFIVDPDHRGHGYATEALRGAVAYCFDTLGAQSFWGECHTANEASAGEMRAAGLEYIGTVQDQHRFRVGQ